MIEYGAVILISDSKGSSCLRTAFHTDLRTCIAWRLAPMHRLMIKYEPVLRREHQMLNSAPLLWFNSK